MKARPRLLKRMSVENDRMRESDRLFFERFPWRKHRLRRLGRAEIAQLEDALNGTIIVGDPTADLFVIIKNLAPGVRLRLHIPGPAGETGDDVTEEHVAALWDRRAANNPALLQQELQIEKAMRRPGGPLHQGGMA